MTEFKYKLGLKKSNSDHRDLKMQVPHGAILPNKYEIPIIRCVYDQGDIGSCSSNVICNQIMSLKDYSDNEYPSRLFQYYNSRLITGNEAFDEGSTYRDAYKALSKFGFIDENLFPYNTSKYTEKPPQEAYDKANKSLVKKYQSLIPSLYSIQYAINQNLPVAIGCLIYENFKDLDENFVVQSPKGQILGGHAMIIRAYDNETKLFKIHNSWGVGWGDKGCCYMHYEHVLNQNYVFEFWAISKE
jgi:C1A family cysteine protease